MAAWLLVGPLAFAAQEPIPTVSFVVVGNPPGVCGSRPTVSSLALPQGTSVVLANDTGLPAQVTVGGTPVLGVPAGDGAVLVLASGQHDVRVVPSCTTPLSAAPLVVNVTGSGPPSAPPGPPASLPGSNPPGSQESHPPGSNPSTSPGASPPARAGGGSAEPGASGVAGGTVPASVDGTTGTDLAVVGSAAATARVPGPQVLSVTPIDLDASLVDPKGVRLVAAIATICVLGVTAAIIRSIVRLNA
jgi:hypothetical protein